MEFFEKLGKKASETYKTAAEKTNRLATETKLKAKINDCKSKIKDIYKEIGKKVYQKYNLGGDLNIKDDIEEELKRIDELTEQIEKYEKQKLELSDIKECVNCKEKIKISSTYCSKCGAKQPEETVHEVEILEEQEESNGEFQNEEIKEEKSDDFNIENKEEIVDENMGEIVDEIMEEEEKKDE